MDAFGRWQFERPAKSYRRLMGYFDDFDDLMPGHNQPWLRKDLLPET